MKSNYFFLEIHILWICSGFSSFVKDGPVDLHSILVSLFVPFILYCYTLAFKSPPFIPRHARLAPSNSLSWCWSWVPVEAYCFWNAICFSVKHRSPRSPNLEVGQGRFQMLYSWACGRWEAQEVGRRGNEMLSVFLDHDLQREIINFNLFSFFFIKKFVFAVF